jgi:hypothetical protein
LPVLAICEARGGVSRRQSSKKRGETGMTSRPELNQQYDLIGSLQPALHAPQNWNYENTHPLFEALMHPPHDVGGQPDVPIYYEEKEEEQWELNTIRDLRGSWLERRLDG